MPTKVYAGTEVTVNDEGFFADPQQWREEMAPQIAQESGVGPLTPQHWQVVKFMRHEYAEKGTGPSVRAQARREDRRHSQAPRLHLRSRCSRPY